MQKLFEQTVSTPNASAWRQWLMDNHSTASHVWLIIYKKKSGIPSVYYPEALEVALCFGWIDSAVRKRDDQSYFQYYSPRKTGSNWSKINKDKAEQLIAQGRMMTSGLNSIAEAKESGGWDALNAVEKLILPAALQEGLNANAMAKENWNKFPRSVKRGILEWISNARTAATRNKRIQQTISKAEKNERANFPDK